MTKCPLYHFKMQKITHMHIYTITPKLLNQEYKYGTRLHKNIKKKYQMHTLLCHSYCIDSVFIIPFQENIHRDNSAHISLNTQAIPLNLSLQNHIL